MEEKDKNFTDNENNNSINMPKVDTKSNQYSYDISPKVTLSRKMRWITFFILAFLSILFDIDQGILSSSTSTLIVDFKMTERELGGFGSMIFLGTGLGCLFSFTLINKFNRKYLLLGTMTFDVLSLFLTTKTTNIFLLYLYRIIAGFTLSFLTIYVPVWSDQFGIHKHKSVMLSIIHLSSSFGSLFGYAMGILMGWKNAFYLQNVIIIINIVIILLLLPNKYFSKNLMPLKAKLDLLKNNEEKDKNENKIDNDIKDINVDINEFHENNELIKENKNIEERKKEEDEISLFEDIQTKIQDNKHESILMHIKVLIKSKVFILMNITLSSLFLIVAAIQFWSNDYLEKCLFIEDEKKRLYYFLFLIMTSPPAGIIVGGILSSKVGGYDNKKAINIPLIASFLVCIFANIVPLSRNLYFFLPTFSFFLFLGSVVLPVAHGILLVSVDKQYAGSASSLSTLIYNFFGRLPGPNLYAFYRSLIKDIHSRIPFWLLLNMAIPGFLACIISIKFLNEKYNKIKNIDNYSKNKFKELEDVLNEDKNH